MFARVYSAFFFLLFALPLLASAASVDVAARWGSQECDTGSLTCCTSTESVSSLSSLNTLLLGLLGVVIGDLTGVIGLTCNSVLGGESCTQQPVCCTDVTEVSLIGLNCSPVNVNL
ncbi:fungal hydrophobin [Pluteus cervinus]|uniref:Fungal hydrophobin n=1 Tax=Pluteus cervinus TaxID=181527 RepID=A0ACD3AK59_9AGAR|nr:fungal hydrophobin [Pluteus cervinus]